jgi:hypothetical protein
MRKEKIEIGDKMKNYLLIFIICLSLDVNAQSDPLPICNAKGLNIYLLNGVMTLESSSEIEKKRT